MSHIIDYKIQCVVYNYIRNILCTDWKVCRIVINLVCIPYLGVMLYGCVSPHLSDTHCRYTIFVTSYIFYTYVSYYWYKMDAKCRCTVPNMCASLCWYGRPNMCTIYTLCSYRCVSPCWHGAKSTYNIYYTSTVCYICVIHNWYKLCVVSWCASPRGCVSPRGCGTSHGYSLTYHTP